MTPAVPRIADVVKDVRREIDRTGLRARNGIRMVAGMDIPPMGVTPKEAVWSLGKATLWRYSGGTVRQGPPMLMFLGLVGRPYVLDLAQGNSMVERLVEDGFDVFLLDWGRPDAAEGDHTLDIYLDDYLVPAIERVRRVAGAEEITILAYCMGAMMALVLLGSRPDLPVRNLVLLTPPCDWEHGPPAVAVVREGHLDPDELVDETTGVVPASVLRTFFKIRKPTSDLVQYANLWQNLWRDEYVRGHRAVMQWVWDIVPIAGPAFRQFCIDYVRDNALMTGHARLGGRPVRLEDIRMPTLLVLADHDDIVPSASSAPIPKLIGSHDVEVVSVPAGHAGAFMGSSAQKVSIPAMLDWLRRHSVPAEAR